MGIAIHTKYIGPTNTKGARIKASCVRGRENLSVFVSFDYALGCEERHAKAVFALLAKFAPELAKDHKLYCCGSTMDNLGYVFSINPTIVGKFYGIDTQSQDIFFSFAYETELMKSKGM